MNENNGLVSVKKSKVGITTVPLSDLSSIPYTLYNEYFTALS